jgi:hypothetical protein
MNKINMKKKMNLKPSKASAINRLDGGENPPKDCHTGGISHL